MPQLIAIQNTDDLQQYEVAQQIPPLDAQALVKYPPDAHWILADGGLVLGRLSLWWTKTPAYGNDTVGVIGHYAVRDAAASHQLLTHACTELTAHGCTLAVGPMDGNTLQRYRFLIERGEEPPFLLEPDNPDEWPEYWHMQDFTPLAAYYSSFNEDLSYEDPRIPRAAMRLEEAGVTIRTMQPEAFEDDLRRIYQVAAVSFQQNFLYVPFSEEEYLNLYRPFRPYVRPETVFIAEHDGKPVGFMFNIPDHLQAQRGERIDTFILKTFAVLPGRTYAGLGNVLVAHSHRIARELGYRRAIHALMYEGNNSLIISNRFSRPFRRYALFARALQP